MIPCYSVLLKRTHLLFIQPCPYMDIKTGLPSIVLVPCLLIPPAPLSSDFQGQCALNISKQYTCCETPLMIGSIKMI